MPEANLRVDSVDLEEVDCYVSLDQEVNMRYNLQSDVKGKPCGTDSISSSIPSKHWFGRSLQYHRVGSNDMW